MIAPAQPTWANFGTVDFITESLKVEGFVEVHANNNVNFLPVVWWDGRFYTAHSLKISEHVTFKGTTTTELKSKRKAIVAEEPTPEAPPAPVAKKLLGKKPVEGGE